MAQAVIEHQPPPCLTWIKQPCLPIATDELFRRRVPEADQLMSRQIIRIPGYAVLIKVAGRCSQNPSIIGQFSTLETAVVERSVAQGKVEAALDQIEGCIGQPQVELDARVARQELRQ